MIKITILEDFLGYKAGEIRIVSVKSLAKLVEQYPDHFQEPSPEPAAGPAEEEPPESDDG